MTCMSLSCMSARSVHICVIGWAILLGISCRAAAAPASVSAGKRMVNDFFKNTFGPIKMHINSMSRFGGQKAVFVFESSIWTYKCCGFLTLGTLHGTLFSIKEKRFSKNP